ncbi:MAG: cardiolipin synthase [Oscillospiraceae bacterium]
MRKVQKAPNAERNVSAALRIVMVLLTLAAHIAVILLLSSFLEQYASYVYVAIEAAAFVCALRIFNRNESANYKLLWILLIASAPVAAMILYALLGNTDRRQRQGLMDNLPPPVRESQRMRSENNLRRLRKEQPKWSRMAAYLQKKDFLLYSSTESRYFSSGEAYFEDLIARMEQAERFIFLEYFIVAEGQLWDRVFSVLRQRAAQGVEVKLLFDDFGNITRFSGKTLAEVRQAGIEVEVFNPVHRYVNRLYFNYRDHRKIAVVDGEWAYTGGINIADEYANLIVRFGHWKDSAVRLHGDGVWGLTRRFIQMWERLGGELEQELDYYRPLEEAEDGQGFCQFVTDGPENNPDNPAESVYLQLMGSARRFLYITTPYLAVEDYLINALCCAAEGGVDVRLMLPGIPDKKYVFYVSGSYFEELLRHGVRIYEYTPGFLHAKSVMADREVALVGSVNMDYRSFQLHYEDAALLYGTPVVEELLQDMDDIMEKSREITLESWRKRGWFHRMLEQVLRLFAIWM